MTSFDIERRKILQASGAAVLAGLAGCTGILADGKGVPGRSPDVEEPNGKNGGGNNVPEAVDTYLNDNEANGYDGSLTDRTGESEVTIEVGAGNGLSFGPAAVRVDPGTTIIWEWTGNGGGHNVNVNEGPTSFKSETISEAGFTFSQTLEQEGNYLYECTPHNSLGMHGAIVVGGGGGGGGVPSAVDTYLNDNDANGYEGSVTDMTGEGSISISVGAGDGLAFDPVAVVVDAGTEVTWEWTGNGGGHNVNVNEGPTSFKSETVSEAGFTFSQTLDDAGNYLYECTPHNSLGMHGAVIVQAADDGQSEGEDGSNGQGSEGEDGSNGQDGGDNQSSEGGE
jgi:halocyanin-like protein